ncbi:MAG: trehalose-phosphatase, partial [Silvanigrellaceae bacterium]
VISGRKRSDVERFLPQGIDFVIGNHGVEGLPSGTDTIDTAKKACLQWKSELEKDFADSDDVWLEDKTYSLSLHYRKATDKKKARTQLLEAVSSLTPPPRIVLGKFCINIMPAGAPHKGVALLELMLKSNSRCAVYLGDDDNDEDVFSLSEENLLTIRIEESNNSGALYCLSTQLEIDDFLVKTLEFCKSHGSLKRMT